MPRMATSPRKPSTSSVLVLTAPSHRHAPDRCSTETSFTLSRSWSRTAAATTAPVELTAKQP